MDDRTALAEPNVSALDPNFRHELLADVIAAHASKSGLTRFGTGLKLTFRSAKLLLKTKELWGLAVVPAAINISLFLFFAITLLWNHAWFLPGEPTGEGFVTALLYAGWWILRVILIPLLIFLAYFLAMLLAQVIASPFNDALSEKVETVLHGQPIAGPTGLADMVKGGIKGGFQALILAVGKLVIALPLGFIPVVGPVFTATIAAYFFAVDNTDYAFERRRYGIRQKLRKLLDDKALTLGFGMSVWAVFAIPLLNFFCMPLAVIGGTTLALAYHEGELASEGDQQ